MVKRGFWQCCAPVVSGKEEEEEDEVRQSRVRSAPSPPPLLSGKDASAGHCGLRLFLRTPPQALGAMLAPQDLYAASRVARAVRHAYRPIYDAHVVHVIGSGPASLNRALGAAPNARRATVACGWPLWDEPAMLRAVRAGGALDRLTHLVLLGGRPRGFAFPATLVSLAFQGGPLRGLPPGLRALTFETGRAGALTGNVALPAGLEHLELRAPFDAALFAGLARVLDALPELVSVGLTEHGDGGGETFDLVWARSGRNLRRVRVVPAATSAYWGAFSARDFPPLIEDLEVGNCFGRLLDDGEPLPDSLTALRFASSAPAARRPSPRVRIDARLLPAHLRELRLGDAYRVACPASLAPGLRTLALERHDRRLLAALPPALEELELCMWNYMYGPGYDDGTSEDYDDDATAEGDEDDGKGVGEDDDGSAWAPLLPPQLKRLYLRMRSPYGAFFDTPQYARLRTSVHALESLRELRLGGMPSDDFVLEGAGLRALESLTLEKYRSMDFAPLARACPNLRALRVLRMLKTAHYDAGALTRLAKLHVVSRGSPTLFASLPPALRSLSLGAHAEYGELLGGADPQQRLPLSLRKIRLHRALLAHNPWLRARFFCSPINSPESGTITLRAI